MIIHTPGHGFGFCQPALSQTMPGHGPRDYMDHRLSLVRSLYGRKSLAIQIWPMICQVASWVRKCTLVCFKQQRRVLKGYLKNLQAVQVTQSVFHYGQILIHHTKICVSNRQDSKLYSKWATGKDTQVRIQPMYLLYPWITVVRCLSLLTKKLDNYLMLDPWLWDT